MAYAPSVLPILDDGSVYHLGLTPGDVADTVILVGDPDRVPLVTQHFDQIEVNKRRREFVTHTGTYQGKRITVLSTGIGLAGIEIVLNELDVLVNVDFDQRTPKSTVTSLDIIRLGTCGSLDANIAVDSLVVSNYALSLSNDLSFYQQTLSSNEHALLASFQQHLTAHKIKQPVAVATGDAQLITAFSKVGPVAMTLTAPGFYAAQQRQLRVPIRYVDIIDVLSSFNHEHRQFANFEMETAMIYGLGRLLGFRCCSISAVIFNRVTQQSTLDHAAAVKHLIAQCLSNMV